MDSRSRERSSGLRQELPYMLRFSALWIVVSVAAVLTAGLLGIALIIEGPPPAQQGRLLIILGLQMAVVIVALLVLAFFTTARLAEPWRALLRALGEVRDGDLSVRISFRTADTHLKELEVAFEEMMVSLRSKVAAGEDGGDTASAD